MSKTYVFYHDDLDGLSSYLILKNYYYNVKGVVCSYEKELINPLDIINHDDEVIIVDYSFSPEIMIGLFNMLGNRLIWLDHHISAIKNSQNHKYSKIRGLRNVKFCGAELSWAWCKPNVKTPDLIKSIGEFDTFRNYGTNTFKKALMCFYGIKSYDESALERAINDCYYNDNNSWYERFLLDGRIIYDYKMNEYKEDGINNSYVRNIWGLKVLCMNSYYGGISLQMPGIYNPKEHDMIVTYNYNGENWCYGFYTDTNAHPEVDCSKIAIQYEGGGHKGAAGARSNELIKELL